MRECTRECLYIMRLPCVCVCECVSELRVFVRACVCLFVRVFVCAHARGFMYCNHGVHLCMWLRACGCLCVLLLLMMMLSTWPILGT